MSKVSDVEDLLGEDTVKPTKKPAAKKTAAAPTNAEAKTASAKKVKPTEDAEAPAKRAKVPVVFEEGEREALMKRVKQVVKKPWNSKELAVKLDVPTRKLRQVLYAMSRAGTITLELAASRALGMTVSPAAA